MNSGELLYIKVRPTSPVTAEIVKDATGTAYLFAPPKNPQANPADRTPDHTIALAYDPGTGFYLGTQDSTGFAPGTWWCQGKVTGGAGNVQAWSYQSFSLGA